MGNIVKRIHWLSNKLAPGILKVVCLSFRASLIGLLSILVVGSWSSRAEAAELDTIYVSEQGRDGVFVAQSGSVTKIKPTWLELNQDGTKIIYKRAAVGKVELDKNHDVAHLKVADRYWKMDDQTFTDRLAVTVSGGAGLGDYLALFMELFGPRIRLIILIVSMFGIVMYAVYQIYVSVNQRRLSIDKLEMEVLKLRSELESSGLIRR